MWRIALAFAAVYLIWGSTYLAIRFTVETLPPFLAASLRYVIAGGILYAFTSLRGARRPTRLEWRETAIVGGLLLLGGNGGVMWALQFVPSGLGAIIIATVPLWMTLMHWASGGGRPSLAVTLAIPVGLAGMVLLIGPDRIAAGEGLHLGGSAVLVVAALAWGAGSLYSRRSTLPRWPLRATGMEQVAGGLLLLLAGTLVGEWTALSPGEASLRSVLSLAYLVVFGSLVGFTAYMWLLTKVSPAAVSTYAYVNPVVAVFLGWALAAEPVTARTLVAAGIILASVAIITSQQTFGAARRAMRAGTGAG